MHRAIHRAKVVFNYLPLLVHAAASAHCNALGSGLESRHLVALEMLGWLLGVLGAWGLEMRLVLSRVSSESSLLKLVLVHLLSA